MEARQLRDKATEALNKGRFARAAELFEEYCQLEPKDFQVRVRLGDAWVKAGNKASAIVAYQAAAEGFAREGFLPRAIAASKLILELDPSHQGVQQMLANLYARRGGSGGAARGVDPKPVNQIVPAPTRAAMHIELPPEIDEALDTEVEGHAIPGFLPTSYSHPAPKASTPPPVAPQAVQPVAEPAPMAQASAPTTMEVEVVDLDEAKASAPTTMEVEVVDLDDPNSELSSDVGVALDLSDAESGPAEASKPVAQSAPPGLRPRRASDVRPIVQEPPPSQPAPVAAVAPTAPRIERFTPGDGVDFEPPVVGGTPLAPELESGAESLLHAVELAALAGAGQHAAPAPSEQAADDTGQGAVDENVTEPPVQEGSLPTIPLFSDLPRDAFIALFERCPLLRFPEGARIIEQGTRGNAFYVICAGRVRIVRQSGAEQRELAVMGEGAFFGEMALLSGAPRSASVVSAAEETQVLEISAPVLADLSRNFPQVAKALRRFCRQRLLSDVVNTSALFQPFGRKDRRELVERFRAREVRRGEVLIQEGQQVDGLYVVLSGEVAVSKGGQSLAVLHEGDLFGEMSLLQKTPATATVTAARTTSLMRLPREDFDTLILTHPQILALVSELTETRQRRTVEVLLGERLKTREPAGSLAELILF